jgi:hypothetical protein
MLPPEVMLVLVLFAGGYYVGDQAVKGIKKVDVKIVHVIKHVGKTLAGH